MLLRRAIVLFASTVASCGGSVVQPAGHIDASASSPAHDASIPDVATPDGTPSGDASDEDGPSLLGDGGASTPCPADAQAPMACTSNRSCCGDRVCTLGFCCVPLGQSCTTSADCCEPGLCGGPAGPGICFPHPQ